MMNYINLFEDEEKLLLLASSLMKKDFIKQIQPLIKQKCEVISLSISPVRFVVKSDSVVPLSVVQYTPAVQKTIDVLDELISTIRDKYSDKEVKLSFKCEAKRILQRRKQKRE